MAVAGRSICGHDSLPSLHTKPNADFPVTVPAGRPFPRSGWAVLMFPEGPATGHCLKLKKVTPHCGAEIEDLDLSAPLDDAAIRALERALAENGVLFFRDQVLTPEQHKALGRRFGELHIHPAYPDMLAGHPEIMVIKADADSKYVAGEDWHSDVSCDEEPPLGTILHMHVVPPVGGDTLFASMYAAYEGLSKPLRDMLTG